MGQSSTETLKQGFGPAKERSDSMAREAQRQATNKYRKEKVKQIVLRFYPKDEELYEKAKRLGSVGIKGLIEKA